MARKEIIVKKYVVRLSADERDQLAALIRAGRRSAQLLTKARILLKADVSDAGEGWSDSRIAEAVDTTSPVVGAFAVRARWENVPGSRHANESAVETRLPPSSAFS